MTGLLALLREHEGAVEADLQMHCGVDYRDRWRRDEHGRRRLTLRRIAVLVRALPPSSTVATALGQPGWSIGDYLLADVFHAQSGKAHPSRPRSSAVQAPTPDRARKIAGARRRRARRQQAIEAGEIR